MKRIRFWIWKLVTDYYFKLIASKSNGINSINLINSIIRIKHKLLSVWKILHKRFNLKLILLRAFCTKKKLCQELKVERFSEKKTDYLHIARMRAAIRTKRFNEIWLKFDKHFDGDNFGVGKFQNSFLDLFRNIFSKWNEEKKQDGK